MSTEDVKIEKVDIKPTTTYMSPEVKKKAAFKYYNNTYTYITFRPSSLKDDQGEKTNIRAIWNNDIVDWLREAQKADAEHELFGDIEIDKIILSNVFSSYIIAKTGQITEMKELCKALKKRPDILACEFLDQKRVFGGKATLDEMSAFKSKVKKQDVVYDPDVEREKEKEKKKEEAEQRQKEEERKKMEAENEADDEDEVHIDL